MTLTILFFFIGPHCQIRIFELFFFYINLKNKLEVVYTVLLVRIFFFPFLGTSRPSVYFLACCTTSKPFLVVVVFFFDTLSLSFFDFSIFNFFFLLHGSLDIVIFIHFFFSLLFFLSIIFGELDFFFFWCTSLSINYHNADCQLSSWLQKTKLIICES